MTAVRIGCSGWNYDDWRGDLYPPGLPKRRWLEAYAERFDTVEVNATFYRLASRHAVEGWVRATPARFEFAVKASRFLTHVKRLTDLGQGIERFYAPLAPMVEAGKLGPVLWQLPETFHRDDERLAHWLDALPAGRHTIEFRHPSWFAAAVLERLADRGVALTVADHPQRPFQPHTATADWWYVRFHYGARGRNGNYSRSELATWARRIAQWRSRRDVYAYFNNDWNAYAPANAGVLAATLS
ncbi:MAG TPA: DUF72 domain-containing protein [Solirubrobacteraceae bacterium]|nr:DUF72 domain-containing protein [Solirubrobacteraceae bacterium]